MTNSSVKVNINLTLHFENKGIVEKVVPLTVDDSDICDLIWDDFHNNMAYSFNIKDAFFTYTAYINDFIDELVEANIDNIVEGELINMPDDDDIIDYDWTWERA